MGTTVVLAQFRFDRVSWRASATRARTACATAGSSSSPRTIRWPTPCSMPGTITAEELPTHKFKNVLYLYLGSKDARGGPEDVRVLDVRPGDRLLMASDGLTGVVPDKDLARSWARSTTLRRRP